jgi:adenosine kinase
MSILISGSIAFDTIIQTVGTFRAQDNSANPDLHLSLFAPIVRREYGGTAANIAYSLALLWKYPHIIATAGYDSHDYLDRMREMGIKTELIQTIPTNPSLQSFIVHDDSHGQINIFHPWAMNMSWELTHGNIEFDYAIVAPDSPAGMIRRVSECKKSGIFTIFDPGQAMVGMTGTELISLVTIADISIMNEPERNQFQEISGIDFPEICKSNWHIAIVTLGDKWAMIIDNSDTEIIPTIPAENIVDATGCGDSFRAGLLYGLSEWWTTNKSVQLGNIIGGIKIESMGGQNHTINKNTINTTWQREYGIKFFD